MENEENQKGLGSKRLPVWACIPLFALTVFVLTALFQTVWWIGFHDSSEQGNMDFVWQEASLLVAVLLSAAVWLYFEGRPFADLGLSLNKKYAAGLWQGALVATAIYAVGFGLSCALGEVKVTHVHTNGASLCVSWLFFLLVAITEETMMRGYVLGRLLHTSMNKFLALFVSSMLFALLHLLNPNLTVLSMVNLVLAGMLLGTSYLYTRNLCFPVSLHLFWNWLQGPVLGYQVSGNRFTDSLLTLRLPEHTVLNGGDFGFEGSLVCTVLLVVSTLLMVWRCEKREAISLVAPRSC